MDLVTLLLRVLDRKRAGGCHEYPPLQYPGPTLNLSLSEEVIDVTTISYDKAKNTFWSMTNGVKVTCSKNHTFTVQSSCKGQGINVKCPICGQPTPVV